MLRQLVVITTAVLQQLAAQRGSEVEVSRAAGVLADVLGKLLDLARNRPADIYAPTPPADTAALRMMHHTGLLDAFAAAAQAAAKFLADDSQPPRSNPTASAQEAALLLFNNPAHVFAAASTSLLQLWNTLVHFMPAKELLSAQSRLQDTALPAATLTVALARAYAGDKVFCASVMWPVLAASCSLAVAAATGPAGTYCSVLACQEVFELLLLGLAVGTGLLHVEYKGTSAQALLTSMRTTNSTTASSSGAASQGSGSKRVAVSANHQELLQALVGVQQLPALHDRTAAAVAQLMPFILPAVARASRARLLDARGQGAAAANASTISRTSASAKEAVRAGELAPWQLALPLLLTQMELLALAPSFLAEQLSLLHQLLSMMGAASDQLRPFASAQHWQPGFPRPPNWPSLDAVQSHMQMFVESVWLQLGPVLLSICRRSSGEAGEEEEDRVRWVATTPAGERLEAACPRQVFESFSELLMRTLVLSAEAAVSDSRRRPTVNLPVVVEQNPLVACCLVEATLHASTAYSGPPGTDANAAAAAVARLQHASITCFAATLAVPVLTDAVLNTLAARAASAQREAAPTAVGATTAAGALPAAAGQQAAAPVVAAPYAHGSSYCSRLEQKLFCVLVAALKYSQASIALQGPSTAALGPYFNAMALLCVCSSAAIRMLGNVNGPQHTLGDDTTSASARPVAAAAAVVELQARGFEQLIWLDVMGRLLVAAGQLLQQVPQRVTASGDCVLTDRTRPQHNQFARYVDLLQALLLSVKALGMLGVLGQGEAAAATAVAAGTAAATTQADLSRLQQQATGLRKQVEDIQASFEYGVRGMMAQEHAAGVKAMQQLHAACKEGGLPQQLYSFGVAYCAAFPQRGCCGNPACVNLDKFTETALACQGCSGCDKAVKFCSPACHKRAWKHGHKAACAVIKQRQAAAQAPAAHEGA